MKRRDALKSLGALAGVAAAGPKLLACGGGDGEAGITTIVNVMMENRSYDHYFGARALEGLGGDGLSAGMSQNDLDGNPVDIFHDLATCIPDPPHSWGASHAMLNGGAMDGFLTEFQARHGGAVPPHPMGYFQREQIPLSWALADQYTVCDRWFASVMGPTWPNRMYFHSAQSGGLKVNDVAGPGGLAWRSIHHALNDAGVDWAYYYQDLPFVPLFDELDSEGKVRRVVYDFFDDAAAGRLPPVVWVEPAFSSNDDHPPHHPMMGQLFLSTVYNTLAQSPQWNNCLLVVTYDEHGGFYDHVAPPTTADDRAADGFDQLGFRVPTLVAGPYVKPGYTSSVTYDHTSALAHIESMFGLEPLTARDAAANDLTDCIDLERLDARDPLPPISAPEIDIDESMLDAACIGRISEPVDLELYADAGRMDARYDLRSDMRDTLHGMGEQLERLGAGRIRRGK